MKHLTDIASVRAELEKLRGCAQERYARALEVSDWSADSAWSEVKDRLDTILAGIPNGERLQLEKMLIAEQQRARRERGEIGEDEKATAIKPTGNAQETLAALNDVGAELQADGGFDHNKALDAIYSDDQAEALDALRRENERLKSELAWTPLSAGMELPEGTYTLLGPSRGKGGLPRTKTLVWSPIRQRWLGCPPAHESWPMFHACQYFTHYRVFRGPGEG